MRKFSFLGIIALGIFLVTSVALAQSTAGNVVKNRLYGVSLTFPSTWGKMKQVVSTEKTNWEAGMSDTDKGSCPKENGKLMWKVIRFQSRTVPELFVEIHRVPKKHADCPFVADAPHSLLKAAKGFDYYWATSLDSPACDMEPTSGDSGFCARTAQYLQDAESIENSFKLLKKK